MQGQGFRLDISDDAIADGVLAEYIVRDLRLLMVSSVRILNKRIIIEPHKRTVPAEGGPKAASSEKHGWLLDLSHIIMDGMTTYPGLPVPTIRDHLSRQDSRADYAEGTEFQIGRIDMVGNTGTYVDVPFHRYADGADLASFHVDRLANLPGVLVDVSGTRDRSIDWHHFVPIDCGGRAVIIRTGWDRYWRTEAYSSQHPYLTEAAAFYLRENEASLVGIDSINIDDTSAGERPAHSILLAAGIPIVEHLAHLHTLPSEGFRFSAAPPAIAGMGTFSVRAYAVLDSID